MLFGGRGKLAPFGVVLQNVFAQDARHLGDYLPVMYQLSVLGVDQQFTGNTGNASTSNGDNSIGLAPQQHPPARSNDGMNVHGGVHDQTIHAVEQGSIGFHQIDAGGHAPLNAAMKDARIVSYELSVRDHRFGRLGHEV